MYDLIDVSLGNIKIIEYVNKSNDDVEKVYLQNGMLGFFMSKQEMHDLSVLLNYYINIEKIHDIS